MNKPIKKDYDLNDHFQCIHFSLDLILYIQYLEGKEEEGKLIITANDD